MILSYLPGIWSACWFCVGIPFWCSNPAIHYRSSGLHPFWTGWVSLSLSYARKNHCRANYLFSILSHPGWFRSHWRCLSDINLEPFSGPFSTVSEYLSSWVKAELCVISQDPSIALLERGGNHERLKLGQRVLRDLCPDNIYEGVTTPNRFSLKRTIFASRILW